MDTSAFTATFVVDSINIQKPSIIYTNRQYYYPNGYSTVVSVDGLDLTTDQVTIETSDLYQLITVVDSTLSGSTVSVKITAN